MSSAPSCFTDIEDRRLSELGSLDILDVPRLAEFDAVVAIARRLFDCPIATVTMIDAHRTLFKARVGIDDEGCPRGQSFCGLAIYEPDMLVIEDLSADPRFVDNPFVAGEAGLRFYAGVALRPTDPSLPGLGTLCIMDTRVRSFTPEDAEQLRGLATMVCAIIRARASAAATLALSDAVEASANVIHLQNAQLRQAERMVGVGSWRFDLVDGALQWSDHVFAIYGLPAGPTPSFEVAMSTFPAKERTELTRLLERAAKAGEPFDFEGDFTAIDGTRKCVRSMGEAQRVDGKIVSLVGVFQDVTERHERERRLRHSAGTDVLTGLPNRRAFEAAYAEAFAAAQGGGAPLALLLLDLDGFKGVNDALGHDAGDEVLRTIAEQLRQGMLGYTFAARLGGDEFVLLLTRPRDCAATEGVIRTVLASVGSSVIRDGERRHVGVTVGAAILTGEIGAPEELLRRADVALYAAKRDRRGTGRIHGSDEIIRAERPRPRLVSVG